MGKRDYYVLLLPLGVVPRLLPAPDNAMLPVEARAQRKLVAKRIPEITRYILDHEEDWIFSSLTASFEADETFIPTDDDPNMGVLYLPIDVELLVNDGQHRRAAIAEALREDPTIASQTISVVLFPGETLERNQQMFSDLNRTVQKTSRSLDIAYDHRDPLNQLTLAVAEEVPLLRGRVEKETVSLAARSAKLITVSSLYDSLEQLLGAVNEDTSEARLAELQEQAVKYWNHLTTVLPAWLAIADGALRPAEARVDYINVHSVFFFAIGGVGRDLQLAGQPLNTLDALRAVDFRRTNRLWQGICMLGPDIVTRRQTRTALRQQLLYEIGLSNEPAKRVLAE